MVSQLARLYNCDAFGNPIVEKRVETKVPKNLERPAEAPAKTKPEELKEAIGQIPARKMGRPSKGQPWVEAGVSKASWYRQQKERSDG